MLGVRIRFCAYKLGSVLVVVVLWLRTYLCTAEFAGQAGRLMDGAGGEGGHDVEGSVGRACLCFLTGLKLKQSQILFIFFNHFFLLFN